MDPTSLVDNREFTEDWTDYWWIRFRRDEQDWVKGGRTGRGTGFSVPLGSRWHTGGVFPRLTVGARRARARDRLPGTTRKLGNSRISGGEFFVNANWSLAFEPRCFPSRFLFLLLNREEATMFKYRWKDPKSMLVKAVKIIGRIFFRPGRSVSFFSVSVPTITGSRSFVICATILVGRGEGGTGSRLFAHPNAQGAAEIYLQPDSRDAISRDKLG